MEGPPSNYLLKYVSPKGKQKGKQDALSKIRSFFRQSVMSDLIMTTIHHLRRRYAFFERSPMTFTYLKE